MKAREWLERSAKSASPIDAFADTWRGFNNLYASRDKADERRKIRNFLVKAVPSGAASTILESNKNQIDFLLSQPVIDMRGTGADTAAYAQAFKASADPGVRLAELLMIIYQVRCNLEHGQKSPNRERDLQLCQSSFPIVAAIVRHCT